MFRYFIELSYIGTQFRGIQRCINKKLVDYVDNKTIQGCLEQALRLLKPTNEIQTVLSSRTDAGVHALHNTLHVDLQFINNEPRNVQNMIRVLNRVFFKEMLHIRVQNIRLVPDTFHCRFNALGRTYLYRLAVAKTDTILTDCSKNKKYTSYLPVEELNRCFFLFNPEFDINRFINASRLFIGRHDFRSFMCHKKDDNRDHPMFAIRRIDEINIRPGKSMCVGYNYQSAEHMYNYWDIELKGKSFLYNQVRRILGSLISIAINKIDEKCIYEMLTIPSKNNWNPRVTVSPPYALYLCRVHYNENDFILPTES